MKNLKFNSNLIYLIIVILVVLMLFLGQRRGGEVEVVEEAEESVGSGFLEIETSPSDAEIFLDGAYSGNSPITLNNVAAGLHNVVIKKEGYEDVIKEVNVGAGRKAFLEASLVLMVVEEKEETVDIAEEKEEIVEGVEEEIIVEEETSTEALESGDKINIGTKFLLYYDFSEGKFTDKRNFEQDTFSKRYKTYLVFTRLNPVNIKTISKGIDDVEKEDCAGIKGQFEWLYSGQSLCVITKEGQIAAIGGTWEDTENAELTFKVFS